MLEHPTVMRGGYLPLIFILDVEIYLDNLDRVLVIEGDSRNAREL
jgi:hypothetical protein